MANDDVLKRAADMLRAVKESEKNSKAQLEKDRRDLVMGIGQQIVSSLQPLLSRLAEQADSNRSSFENAIRNVRVDVNVPDVVVPDINVPQPKVTVTPPIVNVPEISMPDEMDVRGWLGIMGYDKELLANPIPVQIRDADGNPVDLFGTLTQIVSGGGGGGPRVVKVSNLDEISLTTTGLTDTELRASSVPVSQASGASYSVNVETIFGSTITSLLNGDNRIPVSVESGGSGLTDSELRATAVPVSQVSGAVWSTNVTNEVDIRDLANATDSVSVYQVSGAAWSTEVTNTVTVTGSLTSSVTVGDIPADTADDGSAPVKTGGIARTANPTAVAAGDRVSATYDDVGRQVFSPIQVRDLRVTARAQLTNGTETTLLSGSAGSFHDLVWVTGANNSDAAVSVDIRAVTAGNILLTLHIPANSTAGISAAMPWPQDETGNNWTADMGDITGTTVSLSALFTREV